MATFDLDREVREAMAQKWQEGERTDQEKVEEIIEFLASIPLQERERMIRRIQSELIRLGIVDKNHLTFPL